VQLTSRADLDKSTTNLGQTREVPVINEARLCAVMAAAWRVEGARERAFVAGMTQRCASISPVSPETL
jgi:hypothetical protein